MPIQNLSDEQRAFVEAIRDFARRECGTREQRDALTDGGTEELAGVSLLRFDPDGLVTEHRDFWNAR